MTTKINPIFQRREISTEEAVDAFGPFLPSVVPTMIEITRIMDKGS